MASAPNDEHMESGCSKKRKLSLPHDHHNTSESLGDRFEHNDGDRGGNDGVDEEKKMEEFFALIRNIREIRDYIIASRSAVAPSDGVGVVDGKRSKEMGGNDMGRKPVVPAWIPCFRHEDFTVGGEDSPVKQPGKTLASGLRSPRDQDDGAGKGGEVVKTGLDLSLSL